MSYLIAVHTGAGNCSDDTNKHLRSLCRDVCTEVTSLLRAGCPATDAAVAAIVLLEASPLTNAGTGSSIASNKKIKTEASLLASDSGFHCAGDLENVGHPIKLVAVMARDTLNSPRSGYVPPRMMVGQDAVERYLARDPGIAQSNLATEHSIKMFYKARKYFHKSDRRNSELQSCSNDGRGSPGVAMVTRVNNGRDRPGVTRVNNGRDNPGNGRGNPWVTMVTRARANPGSHLGSNPGDGRANPGVAMVTRARANPGSHSGGNSGDRRDMPGVTMVTRGNPGEGRANLGVAMVTRGYPGDGRASPGVEDTVGVICIDTRGRMTCAASSGGSVMKYSGRLGQCCVHGAGSYLTPDIGVLTTGNGEQIINKLLALTLASKLQTSPDPITALDSCFGPGDTKMAGFLSVEKLGDGMVSVHVQHSLTNMVFGVQSGSMSKAESKILTAQKPAFVKMFTM